MSLRSCGLLAELVGWVERSETHRFGDRGIRETMGFAEPVIGPATSGRTRWLYPSYVPRSAVHGACKASETHRFRAGALRAEYLRGDGALPRRHGFFVRENFWRAAVFRDPATRQHVRDGQTDRRSQTHRAALDGVGRALGYVFLGRRCRGAL